MAVEPSRIYTKKRSCLFGSKQPVPEQGSRAQKIAFACSTWPRFQLRVQ